MRKLIVILVPFLVVGCASLKPFGENTKLTKSYYYKTTVRPGAVYSCMQDELFSYGYLLEYKKVDNKSDINRFDVMRKSERLADLEINSAGSSISSQAFVKNDLVRKDLEAAQAYCVKHTGYSTSMTEAIIEGLWSGLK
ncbi:Uncharacterised protein [Serratia ficaria]|nr:Uncharacterised protein [Serratia ficaria]CAI2030874.1 Uncharacterised protein [Serratia ficaria]CAI2538029.1 Uncharacterised protein [Serratia ficaria]CAI2539795.1 Uncharacterised protein [Serratia ficaria]CAI2794315.1 Uncharacterised protein [Serratia ficaria]